MSLRHAEKHVDSRLPLFSDVIKVPPIVTGYQKCAAGKFTANKVQVLQYGAREFRFKHLILRFSDDISPPAVTLHYDRVSCPIFSFVCHVLWPSLWSSRQSSWLQIQRSGIDSRRYQIFWEAVGLERGPLSLVSTIEEVLERKSSGSGLESR
jgi:hypothetical protein